MTDGLFDVALKPERTELAWRRTALAIGVGSLVSFRILPGALGGPAWALLGLAGIVIAAALWVGARLRYRRFMRAYSRPMEESPPGGGQLLFLATFSAGCGALALLVILVEMRRTFTNS